MPTPILVTKLFVPPGVPHAVARSHLVEQLDRSLSRKLTLVCAPAGFGKSSLLAQWAARCKRPCVWVSLEPGERDLQQFLAYLVAAVQTVAVRLGASAWAPVDEVAALLGQTMVLALSAAQVAVLAGRTKARPWPRWWPRCPAATACRTTARNCWPPEALPRPPTATQPICNAWGWTR